MVGEYLLQRAENVSVTLPDTKLNRITRQAPPPDSWNGELLGYVATWRELGRLEDEVDERVEERAGRACVSGWSSADLTLPGLRPFARYALSVRAYNRAGAGPHSPTLYATTADGGLYTPVRLCARCTPRVTTG